MRQTLHYVKKCYSKIFGGFNYIMKNTSRLALRQLQHYDQVLQFSQLKETTKMFRVELLKQ